MRFSAEPLVSVVIPVYNHELFLKACVESVFKQTYPSIEVIALDDGSTDLSFKVLETLKAQWPKFDFTIMKQTHQGAAATINELISLTRGDYISILNSDDLYHPHRLERFMAFQKKNQFRLGFSDVQYINSENEQIISPWYEESRALKSKLPSNGFSLLNANIAVSTGNLFFTRELFKQVGPFADLETCHDWDFILRCLLHTEPFWIEEPLLYYRKHASNTIKSKQHLNLDEEIFLHHAYARAAEKGNNGNPLAPCLKNWGVEWTHFEETYLAKQPWRTQGNFTK